jgi:carboxyl-terminal processing protease
MLRRPALCAAALVMGGPIPVLLAQQRSAYEELQTFSGVLNYVRANYVDSVSVADLVRAAIDGTLRSLDPHSYFIRRQDWERFAAWEQGRFVTTGLSLEYEEGAVAVEWVAPDSPADRAGLLPGDRLLALDDTVVAGLSLQQLEARLVGEKGSKVRLTLARGSRLEPDTFSVSLKRAATPVRSTLMVRMVDSVTGYVRLLDFKLGAGRDVHEAIGKLRGDGARQVILDLRRNPGGLMPAAVEVASEFLPRNALVFRTRGRKADTNHDFVTDHDGGFATLPLIVLIDGGSASAAEALAACLQDHDRALILGRRSFGKALEQISFPLPTGDVVMLTVARIVSPSGRIIQRRYQGLGYEQYLALAGKSDAGTGAAAYATDHGRPVAGGGGVTPDVTLSPGPPLPAWWSVAADSGFGDAVADSVARGMPHDQPGRWLDASDQWLVTLVPPFLAHVRSALHVSAPPDTALTRRLGRILAARVTQVNWGPDVYEQFLLRNDPDVHAALGYFPRLAELLGGAK